MNVLFVCNGNVARSQEAETFYNSMIKDESSKAVSAGINVKVGKPIDPLVVQVMQELGYDLSAAKRKFVESSVAEKVDIIVSFKPKNELPEYLSKNPKVRYWIVADPQHQSVEFHRGVRDEVKARVETLIDELSI